MLRALITIAALALAGVLAGCGGASLSPTGAIATKAANEARAKPLAIERASMEPVGERLPLKVGLVLPLTGSGHTALIAEAMQRAAEVALADLKAPHVELVVRDDRGLPEGAMAAVDELIAAGVEVVLGPLFAPSVVAAAPAARRKGVPLIAFSNDRQVAGQGVHLLSFLPPPEITRVVAYAAGRGKKRFAALVPDDAYGKLAEASLREAVGIAGGTVVHLVTYPAAGTGTAASVLRLRDALRGLEEHGDPIDALFLPAGDDQMPALLGQIGEAGIDLKRIQLIGTGALDSPFAEREARLAGAWYAAPDPQGFKLFAERYGRQYGHAPPRIASLAYDAIGLTVSLSGGPAGARYIPGQLTRAAGFTGLNGAYRLMADGVTDRALAVLEIRAGGAVVIDAAAPGFGQSLAAVPRSH